MSPRRAGANRLAAAVAGVPEYDFTIRIVFRTSGPFSVLFASGEARILNVLTPLLRCIYFPLPGDESLPIAWTAADEANPENIPHGIKPSRQVHLEAGFKRRGIINLNPTRERHLKDALAAAVVLATGCDLLTVGVTIETDAPGIETYYEVVGP